MLHVIQYHEWFLTTGHRHHQNRLRNPEHVVNSRHRQTMNCQHLPADYEKLRLLNFLYIYVYVTVIMNVLIITNIAIVRNIYRDNTAKN